jgi:hypothetical protein
MIMLQNSSLSWKLQISAEVGISSQFYLLNTGLPFKIDLSKAK